MRRLVHACLSAVNGEEMRSSLPERERSRWHRTLGTGVSQERFVQAAPGKDRRLPPKMSISLALPRSSLSVLPGRAQGIAHPHDGSFSSAEVLLLSRLPPQWHESLLRLSRPVSSL